VSQNTQYAYVNGEIVAEGDAKISIYDRGFLFADGVYEVSSILGGNLVDNDMHLKRLQRSLDELELTSPVTMDELTEAQHALVKKNEVDQGMLYLQITRGGTAPRQFHFPKNATPSLVMFTQHKNLIDSPEFTNGIKAITIPEIRWKRRDIKSVALLAQALGKQQAVAAGADEALMVENGHITEGTSSTAFIVVDGNKVISRRANTEILNGITRQAVLRLIEETDIEFIERRFTPEEAYAADELFITSASTFVHPVIKLDDRTINDGKPGPIAGRLRELYLDFAQSG